MLIDIVKKHYNLTEKDIGDLSSYSVMGMKFNIRSYYAEGLGNVSFTQASGMMGAMKMTSLVINPFEIDSPLCSIDYVKAMGNHKAYCELYNTMLEADYDTIELKKIVEKYDDLADEPSKEQWYDDLIVYTIRKSGKDEKRANELMEEALETYLESLGSAKKCDKQLKIQKAKTYSDGLLEHGGPATDPVKKKLGLEKTTRMFNQAMFGVEI